MTVVSKSPESFHREGCGEVDPEFRRLADGIHIDSEATRLTPKWSILLFPEFPWLHDRSDSMPTAYEIDKQRRLVISTGLEPLTLADALAHQDELARDADFDASFSQILDLTRVTMINLGANDIRRLAQKTIFSPESRRAIIVSSDLVYGLGRMYEILREIAGGDGIRVFRDFDEALDWVLSKNLTA